MHFLLETLKLGFSNLRLHKLRSLLTVLGIIFGVAAVIAMVAIGEGNKREALADIRALGANNIILRSVKPGQQQNDDTNSQQMLLSYGLQRRDLEQITSTITGFELVAPLKAVAGPVTNGSERVGAAKVFGITPQLQDVASLRVERGRFISDADMEHRSAGVVIGSEIARQLFVLSDPLNHSVRIGGQLFEVIGVLAPVGFAGGGGSVSARRNINFDVYMPMTTARSRYGDNFVDRTSGSLTAERVEISEIYLRVRDGEDVLSIAEQIKLIFDPTGPNAERSDEMTMIVPRELLEQAERTQGRFNALMIAIASISLLVGGIGIMNIMLASVTERTREIGIRRALGATRHHIAFQFLVETTLLSCMGGLLGIALGLTATFGLQWLARTHPDLASPDIVSSSIGVSFLVSTSVGIIFGLYPAIAASRQDPIVALRHD